jgi:hypothetical protein
MATDRDPNRIIQREHQMDLDAKRVYIVGGADLKINVDTKELIEGLKEGVSNSSIQVVRVPEIVKEYDVKVIEVEKIVYLDKLIQIEVPKIIYEPKIIEITKEKIVIEEKIREIEVEKNIIIEKVIEKLPGWFTPYLVVSSLITLTSIIKLLKG